MTALSLLHVLSGLAAVAAGWAIVGLVAAASLALVLAQAR